MGPIVRATKIEGTVLLTTVLKKEKSFDEDFSTTLQLYMILYLSPTESKWAVSQ